MQRKKHQRARSNTQNNKSGQDALNNDLDDINIDVNHEAALAFSDLNGDIQPNDKDSVQARRGQHVNFARVKDDPENQWHGRLKRVPTSLSYEMSDEQQ